MMPLGRVGIKVLKYYRFTSTNNITKTDSITSKYHKKTPKTDLYTLIQSKFSINIQAKY